MSDTGIAGWLKCIFFQSCQKRVDMRVVGSGYTLSLVMEVVRMFLAVVFGSERGWFTEMVL